jgi:hypothetical protein
MTDMQDATDLPTDLDACHAIIAQLSARLSDRETMLSANAALLDEKTTMLTASNALLDEKTTLLDEKTTLLDEKTTLLTEKSALLVAKETLLVEQATALIDLQASRGGGAAGPRWATVNCFSSGLPAGLPPGPPASPGGAADSPGLHSRSLRSCCFRSCQNPVEFASTGSW